MKLNFSSEYYKNKALGTNQGKESNHSVGDAFLLLIKGVYKEDLSNLCEMIKESQENQVELTLDECYDLTQGKDTNSIKVDENLKETILNLAYTCIESGKTLGEKTIQNGKINTSSWMSHALYEGKLASEFAEKLGIDAKTAQIQGILHDYGRKVTHSFEHVTRGYEELVNEGWDVEAIASLTHSFLNGGRCASNEQAEEGFYVDENGEPKWKLDTEKDDITLFLEGYEYNKYDTILNISDLMATSDGIVSPYDRILDIATRRTLDPTNRGYFLAEFTNTLVDILKETECNVPENLESKIKATPDMSIDMINGKFKNVSDLFYQNYIEQIASKRNIENLCVSPEDIARTDMESKLTSVDIKESEKLIDQLINKDRGDR